MAANWNLKTFDQLTVEELYALLRLRSAVFVIEQDCVFEEIDGLDRHSCHHLFRIKDGEVLAYVRLFPPGAVYPQACISRVCTAKSERRTGLGKELMATAIEKMEELYPSQPIRIGAQLYLKKFYEEFGFVVDGEHYLEDGIPHVHMLRKL